MASNIGPKFALEVEAPAEWNRHMGDHEAVIRTPYGEAYVVWIYSRTFRDKLLLGERQWIFLGQVIREDAEELYAFEDSVDRALFIELREIDSVGPKTAALAVSALGKKGLMELLRGAPLASYKVSGLGPKTLEKIVAGMKSRSDNFLLLLSSHDSRSGSLPSQSVATLRGAPQLLVQSLEKLGLKPSDTLRVYNELLTEDKNVEDLDGAELVRRILQKWGQMRARSAEVRS